MSLNGSFCLTVAILRISWQAGKLPSDFDGLLVVSYYRLSRWIKTHKQLGSLTCGVPQWYVLGLDRPRFSLTVPNRYTFRYTPAIIPRGASIIIKLCCSEEKHFRFYTVCGSRLTHREECKLFASIEFGGTYELDSDIIFYISVIVIILHLLITCLLLWNHVKDYGEILLIQLFKSK